MKIKQNKYFFSRQIQKVSIFKLFSTIRATPKNHAVTLQKFIKVGCKIESNCPLVGPATKGGVKDPVRGVFLRLLKELYLNKFKTENFST